MIRRPAIVYALVACAWAALIVWQVVEHNRVINAAKVALLDRGRDITSTLGVVIRSQRRFGGMVSQDRLEPALKGLVKSDELISVALLNEAGVTVASAGEPFAFTPSSSEQWKPESVTLVNLVDLGVTTVPPGETERPTIVLPRRGESNQFAPPFPPPDQPAPDNPQQGPQPRPEDPNRRGARFGRPFRMDEKEYRSLLQERGLHGLAIVMSTESVRRATSHDLWTRSIIMTLATLAAIGLGVAWRNMMTSSALQMRLIKARELNSHLKEMNLAAAGLAHETRNPLNIIRGLAHLISRERDASEDIRKKSLDIINETDRVTVQLNEFINYSRPRELRRAPVVLQQVANEVVQALRFDVEENSIDLQVTGEIATAEADEQMLRQALFNLVLNAIQAVGQGGVIRVQISRSSETEAVVDVTDNGPGVATEHRMQIFKPYFTTHQKGTGLGLAVVQQIVLAHGWEIEYLPNTPKGALFRISHIKLLPTT